MSRPSKLDDAVTMARTRVSVLAGEMDGAKQRLAEAVLSLNQLERLRDSTKRTKPPTSVADLHGESE